MILQYSQSLNWLIINLTFLAFLAYFERLPEVFLVLVGWLSCVKGPITSKKKCLQIYRDNPALRFSVFQSFACQVRIGKNLSVWSPGQRFLFENRFTYFNVVQVELLAAISAPNFAPFASYFSFCDYSNVCDVWLSHIKQSRNFAFKWAAKRIARVTHRSDGSLPSN